LIDARSKRPQDVFADSSGWASRPIYTSRIKNPALSISVLDFNFSYLKGRPPLLLVKIPIGAGATGLLSVGTEKFAVFLL
jgi:hypothetical protein